MTNQENPKFLSREWFGGLIAGLISYWKEQAPLANPNPLTSKKFVDAMKPKNK